MGIREDAEKISVETLGGSLPIGPAFMLAWAFIMSDIIGQLCKDDPMPQRYRLAVSTMERWGMVLPHTALSDTHGKDQPRLFVGADGIKDLRDLFYEAGMTATMVRIFRPLLEMDDRSRAHTHERDEEIIRTLRQFCDARVEEIDQMSKEADSLTCEWPTLMALIGHLIKLMHVALGDADMERFKKMYDEGMAALEQVRGLANAPPQ